MKPSKTVRVTFRSKFHGTEADFAIKRQYTEKTLCADAALEYEVFIHGPDAAYARRKLAFIRETLCGHGKSCRCSILSDETTVSAEKIHSITL